MTSVRYAIWLVALLLTMHSVFVLIGLRGLALAAPEGKRWWHFPAQLLSLGVFAAVVLLHPFR